MDVTPRSRRQVRLQNAIFVVLLLAVVGLLAWLSTRYSVTADWTAGNRNTLSEPTQELLARIDEPLQITAFVAEDETLHRRIEERIERYRRHKPEIGLEFVNPELSPSRAEAAGVRRAGQLVIRLGERSEVVDDMAEQTLARALQQLTREGETWIAFVQGHGERDPQDDSDSGYSQLRQVLTRSGFQVQRLNLVRNPQIPDDTRVLVLAGPREELLPGEIEALKGYVAGGGNLLWLQDPREGAELPSLAEALGVDFLEGVLVDASTRLLLGVDNAAVIPVVDYGQHPVTKDLSGLTVFPIAGALKAGQGEDWQSQTLLRSLERAWAETGGLSGEITYDEGKGDRMGPLTLGVALTRDGDDGQQRVAVVGDSNFLANGFLGFGANLDLGRNLFNWLSRDDELVAINPRKAPDTRLQLPHNWVLAMGLGFLIVLPLALIGGGFRIWYRRRRR